MQYTISDSRMWDKVTRERKGHFASNKIEQARGVHCGDAGDGQLLNGW